MEQVDLAPRRIGRPPSCICGECRRCRKAAYMRAYYASKSPEDRRRIFVACRDPERVRLADLARSRTPAKQDSIRRSQLRYPEREAARRKVHTAVARGKLVKQPCHCGADRVEAHHPDYAKPLDVVWLCRRHHVQQHPR